MNAPSGDIRKSYKDIYGESGQQNEIILLDAEFTQVLPGSWVLLKASGQDERVAAFRVTKAESISRADFALSAQVTAAYVGTG